MYSWRNPWSRWGVLAAVGTTLAAVSIGFVWLPSVQGDFSAQGVWAGICRAAGVPRPWGRNGADAERTGHSTRVSLSQAMARPDTGDAAGRGATLALQQCTMCHGVHGASQTDVPSLAGQHKEVVLKQLLDYQTGERSSAIMQAMAGRLSARDVSDLASYYASLRGGSFAPSTTSDAPPALVATADAMRNIAACTSCHGGVDHKLGAPRLEGMPKNYLAAQLTGFARGARRNDSFAQMRNMARGLSAAEIDSLASFYARR
ncbi:MAG: c-type cytochrome [Pseudomonadota bacterium]|nr:c-type cytochrome [Pseudomonadota bacterium]